ncbi:MAG: isoleucine--tRNA ligase [Solirubrobacterales bacterium]
MRANLPTREPETLKFWREIDLYRLVQEHMKGKPTFILHDGPPYANGHIHVGHALNKILKDIIVKYQTMRGFNSPYTPGWDTHGLPIEQQAIKALGIDRHKTDVVEFRRHCKKYALNFAGIQNEEFQRLGVRADWENPYLTLEPEFEAAQIGVFGDMAKKGYIYKGLKSVYWCCDCETALAEAEIEYADKQSSSIYVKFPVEDARGLFDVADTYVIIWTTTPWTLPANAGIALNAEFDYVLVQVGSERYVLAKELMPAVKEAAGWETAEILKTFKGKDLERGVARHPFFDRDSTIINGEHVTLDAGTGCVHTAPGHGTEDFDIGKVYGLPVYSPVNDKGVFTAEAQQFQGMFCYDANGPIIEELKNRGMLVASGKISHQYPHCWRCKNPIIFRATEQWFASIDGFRQQILENIDKVQWIPSWGRDRIYNMVAERGDWCISRQRTWGVPIPIFYCDGCGEIVINDDTIHHLQDIFRVEGSDAWFAHSAQELLPNGFTCPKCGGSAFTKEKDIMDVWFDSGSSHIGVLENKPGLVWPSDMYLEGSDQHRGWFNSSITTSVAVRGVAPYRMVLTHGFVVDEQGRKMSKSLGNVVDPQAITQELGADILRLWVASADYRNDVAASPNIMKQAAEAYRKIRNTCRFILGNIHDFDSEKDRVAVADMKEADRWALMKLHRLIQRVTRACENHEFHVVYHSIHYFCTIDMSSIYLDIIKDRLYTDYPASIGRRSAQTVMYDVLQALVRMLVPFLAYTTEEIWQFLRRDGDPVTVQMLTWPEVDETLLNAELEARWDRLLKAREVASKALEEARREKKIGHSLGAILKFAASEDWAALLNSVDELDKLFIVSGVDISVQENAGPDYIKLEEVAGLAVKVEPSTHVKCERCWILSPTVGASAEHPTLCARCQDVVSRL